MEWKCTAERQGAPWTCTSRFNCY